MKDIITLLNGEEYNTPDLLSLMVDDDFYYGHLGKQALSSSACKMLLESPKTYYYVTKYGQKEDTPALLTGKLIHTMILEPQEFDNRFDISSTKGKTTKAFKELKETSQKAVITSDEYDAAMRIVYAFNRNEIVKQYLKGATFEQPGIGMLSGLPFRAKADIINVEEGFIADIKTTTDLQSSFRFSARKYGYDMQAYIYTQIFGVKDFYFIAIDKKSLDIGLFTVSEQFLFDGEQKVELAIQRFNTFFVECQDLDSYMIVDKL
jgi:exodeoxyribonuclease VIII